MSEEIVVTQGRVRIAAVGSFAGVYAADEDPPEVCVSVMAEEEHEFVLNPGHTFQVRDQTWKLDRVENLGTPKWRAILTRVA